LVFTSYDNPDQALMTTVRGTFFYIYINKYNKKQKTKSTWYLYGILLGVVFRCEWRGSNYFI